MPTHAIGYLLSLLTCLLLSAELFADSPQAATTKIGDIQFTVAPGLKIEKVSTDDLTTWPIVVDWDREGNLVIAESGGVSKPIAEHNALGLHKIIRLKDTDGDGRFDTRQIVADNMPFPEGVLCLGDDILVAAPPQIWRLSDKDGDGVCEERSIWFDGKTLTGCANDLHGPFLGPDGWVYWCKAAFAEQEHELLDGRTFTSSASHIYRRKLSGGPVEAIFTGGMDNVVEVAFLPNGDSFFTSTFLEHPHDGLRDGIAHAVFGGLYGKQNAVLAGHARTGGLMPILSQLGPAAPSGLATLTSNQLFPSETSATPQPTLVAALFNLQKVTAHQLSPLGASYRSTDIDLVVADRVDFHPTDVLEDSDGSLLIVDTGGWYGLCCPTSRIDQTTATGGIYRLSPAGDSPAQSAKQKADRSPIDWKKQSVGELVRLSFDDRPWVRREANRNLSRNPSSEAIDTFATILNDSKSPLTKRQSAAWSLCQLGTPQALDVLSKQIAADDPSLQQIACHAVGLHRYQPAATTLLQQLKTQSEIDPIENQASVIRSLAEALGHVGDSAAQSQLLVTLDKSENDRFLEHALIHAMLEIERRSESGNLLQQAQSDAQYRAALFVVAQTAAANSLHPDTFFTAFTRNDKRLHSTAASFLAEHPEWASQSTDSLDKLFASLATTDADTTRTQLAETLQEILGAWKYEASLQAWVQEKLLTPESLSPFQATFLATSIASFSPPTLPDGWVPALSEWLTAASPEIRQALIANLTKVKVSSGPSATLAKTIESLANATDQEADRLALLSAMPPNSLLQSQDLESQVVSAFLSDDERQNLLAAAVIARLRLSPANTERLTDHLHSIPSSQLSAVIETIHRSGNDAAKQKTLETIASVPAARGLPDTFLVNLYRSASPELREQASKTANELKRPPANVETAVRDQMKKLKPGDAIKGLQVFRSSKAGCSSCHRIGYVGKELGPDLSRIGGSRTAEAILTAILFPSARLEQSYHTTQVLTVDGQLHSGLVQHSTAQEIKLQIDAQKTVTIPRDEIEETQPGKVSIMPAGIGEQLTIEELSDLMTFLKSTQ